MKTPDSGLRVDGCGDAGTPSKRDKESSSSSPSTASLAARLVEPPQAQDVHEGLLHPAHQVYFRAGLLACREYMARFVEAESPSIAMSIRANWWPSLGQDFGPPRKLEWGELTEGEYGTPEFRVKTAEEVSPTQEALPVALGFLESQRPGSALDRLPRCAACGSADLVYWTDDYSKCVACGGKVLPAGRLVDPQLEVCICAALYMPDNYIIRGHRHDDCLMTAGDYARYDKGSLHKAVQGFLTTRNRFVTREEGMDLMLAANAVSAQTARPFTNRGGILFSEDLY